MTRAAVHTLVCGIAFVLGTVSAAPAHALTLSCVDATECAESVAILVRASAIDDTRCTAFLVAEGTLMTARHCVEIPRRDGGRTLEGSYRATFAATAEHPAETIEARVYRIADPTPLATQSASDWAVLRLLGRTDRAPIVFDRSGLPDGTDVALPVVDVVDADHANLRVLRCRSVLGSIFSPQVDDALAPVVTLAGCDVRVGHSGAPVLDARGRVHGVVHARDVRSIPWRGPLRYPRSLAGAQQREPTAIAYATSFVCIDWGRPDTTPPACRLDAWLARTRRPGDAAEAFARAMLLELDARSAVARDELAAAHPTWTLRTERDGPRARVFAVGPCGPSGRAELEARSLAIVVAANGRPTLVERSERGSSRAFCAAPLRERAPSAPPSRAR